MYLTKDRSANHMMVFLMKQMHASLLRHKRKQNKRGITHGRSYFGEVSSHSVCLCAYVRTYYVTLELTSIF